MIQTFSFYLFLLLSCINSKEFAFSYKKNIHQKLNVPFTDSVRYITFIVDDSSFLSEPEDKRRLQFYYIDSLGIERFIDLTKPNRKLFTKKPIYLIEYNYLHIPFYIYPGEHIKISLKADKSLFVTVEGNNKRNKELEFFPELINRTDLMFTRTLENDTLKIEQISEKERKIAELKNSRYVFLDSFCSIYPINISYMNTVRTVIDNLAIQDSLYLYGTNRSELSEKNQYKFKIFKVIKSLSREFFFDNPYYLQNLDNATNLGLNNKPNTKITTIEDFKKSHEFILTNYKDSLRDYMLYRNFNLTRNRNIQIPKEMVAKFGKTCKNKKYKNEVYAYINQQSKELNSKKDILLTCGDNIIAFQQIFQTYKGKFILFDFWASWCLPCREEIPYSLLLKKQLANQNIEIIYVSLDKDKINWKIAHDADGLPENNSFLFLNRPNSIFAKKYKLNEIPRYMLFGKDGKLLEINLLGPSDPALLPKLKEIIN